MLTDRIRSLEFQHIERSSFHNGEPESDSLRDKLQREALLLLAAPQGISQALKQAFTDNKLESATKVAGAAAVGLGMAYLNRYIPFSGLAGNALRLAGYGSLAMNIAPIAGAMASTWKSKDNFERDVATIKSSTGSLAVDTLLMGAGGLAGARVGKAFFRPPVAISSSASLSPADAVLGVTNRRLASDASSFLPLGKEGPSPRPYYYAFGHDSNTQQPVMKLLSREQFNSALASASERAADGRIKAIVPGMFKAPGEAASDALKLSKAIGPTVVVDHVTGHPLAVHRAIENYYAARASQPFVTRAIGDIAGKLDGNVDLIAHSLGGKVSLPALGVLGRVGRSVNSATFIHPDITVNDFRTLYPQASKGTGRMIVVFDPADRALGISTIRNRLLSTDADSIGRIGIKNHHVLSTIREAFGYGARFSFSEAIQFRKDATTRGLLRHRFFESEHELIQIANFVKG